VFPSSLLLLQPSLVEISDDFYILENVVSIFEFCIPFNFILIMGIYQYLAISIHIPHKIYFYEYTGFSIVLILADYLFNVGIIIISLISTNGSEYYIQFLTINLR
jgi:predicted neutral ceramidase superfamily lipid hydrolase